jgi:hypothetical protein
MGQGWFRKALDLREVLAERGRIQTNVSAAGKKKTTLASGPRSG